MNQQILEDLKLACEPEQETTSRSRIASFFQMIFQTEKYYDHQWKEEKAHFDLSMATSEKLAADYSLQELNEARAVFEEGQLEFQILRSAASFQSDRHAIKKEAIAVLDYPQIPKPVDLFQNDQQASESHKIMNELINQASTLAKRYLTGDFKKEEWWDHQILKGDQEFDDFVAAYPSEYFTKTEKHFREEYEASRTQSRLRSKYFYSSAMVLLFAPAAVGIFNIAISTSFINLAVAVLLVAVIAFYWQLWVYDYQARINSQAKLVCAMALTYKEDLVK
jgi:hypothetical protein